MVSSASLFLLLSFFLLLNHAFSAIPYSMASKTPPFVFPETNSTVLPNPEPFFTRKLLSAPLPTNSFFQNFVIGEGDGAEYIHPYLIQSSSSSLSLSYPSLLSTSTLISQPFVPDFTITSVDQTESKTNPSHISNKNHKISSFSAISVTLDLPSVNLRFFLVRGSPFLTFTTRLPKTTASLSISTIHAIISFSSDASLMKHTAKLNNNQTWLLYSSVPVRLSNSGSTITSGKFSGVLRIALLPDSNPKNEVVLDKYSSCYPISGSVALSKPFRLGYKWNTMGRGKLLMLAHPLHRRLLPGNTVLEGFNYKSIDGDLVGVVGNSWVLNMEPVPVTWHSIGGIKKEHYPEIISALSKDVDNLTTTPLSTPSSYFYGKSVARAARLALIAEEVGFQKAIPKVAKFLKSSIQPWLDGKYANNGFLHEGKWGGLVTKLGSTSSAADFGFGLYNDHHFHLGYFVYAIAVLAKIDPVWGRQYKPQAYSLVADYMNLGLGSSSNPHYPWVRCFDLWTLHSWASGLVTFGDGRNQESTSEAVNAYYAAALLGMAYNNNKLKNIGSTLTALEMLSAQTWWHVRNGDNNIYEKEYTMDNRLVGVLWSTKRDTNLWFAPAAWKAVRLGIQVIPILPITEKLFPDPDFARQVVEWASPSLSLSGEGWKDFVYAVEGIYDYPGALTKIRKLQAHDDGNSLTNILWWIHSQGK